MSGRTKAIGIILLLIIIGMTVAGVMLPVFMISGYDGPVARIVDIDHTYRDFYIGTDTVEYINPNEAAVYPAISDLVDAFVATGLRAEIMALPNILTTEVIDTIEESVKVETDRGTNELGEEWIDYEVTNKTWEVSRIECNMEVTIRTYSGGLADVYGDVVFWIQLDDNENSIFTTADESIVFFVNVYTRDEIEKTGTMDVVPSAGGYDFDLTSIESTPVPQWVIDSGYTTKSNLFRTVQFPLKVLSGAPYLSFITRYESSATWDIGIDVILIGEWEQVKTTRVWKAGVDEPDLMDLAWLVPYIVILVGLICTIAAGKFVHNIPVLLLTIAVIWAVVAGILFTTGFFDEYFVAASVAPLLNGAGI